MTTKQRRRRHPLLAEALGADDNGADQSWMNASNQVITDHDLTITVERIEPRIAERWLTRFKESEEKLGGGKKLNRRQRQGVVDRYADDMQQGGWMLNGSCLCFDTDDHLRDGQHRLQGCVQSGCPFTTLVVRGLDPAAFSKIDQGTRRGNNQVFEMEGHQRATQVTAAAQWVLGYEARTLRHSSGRPSYEQNDLRVILEREPTLLDAVMAKRFYHGLLNPSVGAFCYWLFLRDCGGVADDVDAFFTAFRDGLGLAKGDPALALRVALIIKRPQHRGKAQLSYQAACMIKAWNAWQDGKSINVLVWRPSELFPEVPQRTGQA